MTVAQTKDPIKKLQQDMGALRTRVETLESERPGRKPKPLLAIKQRDVCAIDPDSDSSVCPWSSIYRYQSGCWGTLCRAKQHEAYERRKTARSNGKVKAVAVKVRPVRPTSSTAKKIVAAAPVKKIVKKTPAKATKAPAKRTVKRMAS
jgi:hypothetical protein